MEDKKVTAKFANNIFDRIRGLIGQQTAHGLFIRTRFGIHTFFLKFPIDVVVINKEGSVVKLKEHLKPHRVFLWNPMYDRVVELPKGTIAKDDIKIGTKISIKEESREE